MLRKSTIIKGLILLLVVGVLVSVNLGMGWKKEKSVKDKKIEPVEIYFYLSEKPLLNKEIELVTTVIPNNDLGTGSVRLTFPKAITLMETASLIWKGNIKKDEFIQIPAKIKLTKAGKWEIGGEVKDKDKKVLKRGILTIEVTEADAILDSEEAEYVLNPLPKDKFVFMEIIEENYDEVLRGKEYLDPHNYKGPFFDEEGKRLFEGVKIKRTLGSYYKINEETDTLTVFSPYQIKNDTIIAMGEKVIFKNKSAGFSGFVSIKFLPYSLNLYEREGLEPISHLLTNTLRLVDNIDIIKFNRGGEIIINYGEDKRIILRPNDSWENKRSKIINFYGKEKKILKVKMTTMITIKNHGILDKKKIEIY